MLHLRLKASLMTYSDKGAPPTSPASSEHLWRALEYGLKMGYESGFSCVSWFCILLPPLPSSFWKVIGEEFHRCLNATELPGMLYLHTHAVSPGEETFQSSMVSGVCSHTRFSSSPLTDEHPRAKCFDPVPWLFQNCSLSPTQD